LHAAQPLGTHQRFDLVATAPRHSDRIEWRQQPAKLRCRPLGAACDHGHPPEFLREHLDDQAGFTPCIGMQHEARLMIDPRIARSAPGRPFADRYGRLGTDLGNLSHSPGL